MMSIIITRHGEARMSQRGIRKSDLDLLLAYGTEIGQDRLMIRKRDGAKLIKDYKEEIAKLERLVGKEFVIANGRLITAYHRTKPSKHSKRRTGRRG